MTNISDEAIDLLVTLKRTKKLKTTAGEFIDKRRVLVEYGYKQNGNQLDTFFAELKDAGYIMLKSGGYQLLAKALNWTPPSNAMAQNVTIYSDVKGSNIAHMSTNSVQKLEIEGLDEKLKVQINQLIDAVNKKDTSRVQTIFDGLIIAAPALALQILQIGMGVKG